MYTPSPHLTDEINAAIIQSEIEGGVSMRDLPKGTVVEIETQNRVYTLVSCGEGDALLRGHPTFCPEPVLVTIHGSTWGGSMLKHRYIGRGIWNSDTPITRGRSSPRASSIYAKPVPPRWPRNSERFDRSLHFARQRRVIVSR